MFRINPYCLFSACTIYLTDFQISIFIQQIFCRKRGRYIFQCYFRGKVIKYTTYYCVFCRVEHIFITRLDFCLIEENLECFKYS